ncbi:hypothetical protein SAMN05444008_107140 [Cnuella takakiae]|uniref:Uncharacterized protein n=1 Tax=Cnuella takakiae TaxID=1302690 RepID=A0A1M5B4S2_9BACT|nr:hypothetical protein [Cnuella takakiae]OLY93336.1 hypothetical protein BUE76_16670 [Cnuella takakiae]SHF37469.1 hypothetical protein SAMN05444008_107140 [Cnuella takakiae]
MSMIAEQVIASISDNRTGTDNTQSSNAGIQQVVICGMCGAIEKPLGPHKTECPNCDDYIY